MHVSNTGRTLYTAWAEGDDEWDDLDPVDQIRWQDLAKLVQELEQKAASTPPKSSSAKHPMTRRRSSTDRPTRRAHDPPHDPPQNW